MSRKILKLIALTFAVALALTGCNLVQIDEEIDNAEVVATFNGGTVTKGEVVPAYENSVAYYDYLSSYYGYTLSTEGLLEDTVNGLVETKVLLAKAAELGLDTLTEEEEAAVQEEAAAEYEDTVTSYWDNFVQDGMTDEEIRADVEAYFVENDYTLESIAKGHREEKILEKLQQSVFDGVIVTPEDIQDEYNAMVAADEAAYAEDLYTFESVKTTGGTTVAWYPEGYRTVKHILLMFTEEQQAALADINLQIADLEDQIAALNTETEATAEETESEEGEETVVVTAEDLQAQIDTLNADKEAKIAEYAAAVQPKVDEINAAIAAGEDFDALIDEYNEDEGMKREPAATEGYYVCAESATWVTEFRDAAMALAAIGDVSEPVVTNYGVHIIRYNSDVTPGAVPMAELQEEIEANVTAAKQNEAFTAQAAEWVSEANVKIDLSVVEE